MAGILEFRPIPRLPQDWWTGTDSDTVWPTWGEHNWYTWGANAGNQFVDRGKSLHGGGLASVAHGPSRGRGHPQYVGIDTMALSIATNDKVFASLKVKVVAGDTLVVPVDQRSDQRNPPGKYSMGTGIAINQPDAAKIQAYLWDQLLDIASVAEHVDIPSNMWSPNVLTISAPHLPLPDVSAIAAWRAQLPDYT